MKSIVKKITKFDKKDNYGNTSYAIEFANGDKGYYTSKSENQDKFVINQEAEYTIEKKTGKNGSDYFKISLPSDGNNFRGGGGGRPQVEPRIQMISFSASYAKDIIVGGKATLDQFESLFDRIYTKMISKL